MDKGEALRSIRFDLVEYIQKKVRVNFDPVGDKPISFTHGGNHHMVDHVLARFRTQAGVPANAYLMQDENDQVYLLYFHFFSTPVKSVFQEGHWVLCLRILSDHELMFLYKEERKMLLNMHLKRVIDFHGHLCPDLVLGCKLCEYTQKLFPYKDGCNHGISVLAENNTSSLDAIQLILGTTVGNQRLQVMDFGKHNYILVSRKAGLGFKLSARKQHFGDEEEFHALDEKMSNSQMVMEEVIQFQKLLDERVKHLLSQAPEEIFLSEPVESFELPCETATQYQECSQCGELVLKTHRVVYHAATYCIPCFQKTVGGCQYNLLQ